MKGIKMRVGFVDNVSEGNNMVLVPATFTNAICYGQTGSGKTSSFILPNIENRISIGHTVIVFDYKGNMHLKVKAIANRLGKLDDIIEIGTLWGKSINILEGMSEKEIDGLLGVSGIRSDYWDMSSRALFKSLYFSLLELHELYLYTENTETLKLKISKSFAYSPTFSMVYECLKVNNLIQLVDLIHYASHTIKSAYIGENIGKEKKILMQFDKKLTQYMHELEVYTSIKEEDSDSGNKAVMNTLNNTIKDIARVSFLNDQKAEKIGELIQNKIVMITSENIGTLATKIINSRLFGTLKKRAGKNNVEPVSIFIDEAHKIITTETLPEVSVCRESSFEYIMAVQDELLLFRQLGEATTEELLVNIAYSISYKNNADERCKHFDTFQYLIFSRQNQKGRAIPIFIDSITENEVEKKFQQKLNLIETYTTIIENDGYLENDSELFFRDQAYFINMHGNKIIVRICSTVEHQEVDFNFNDFCSPWNSKRRKKSLSSDDISRVDQLETAVSLLIQKFKKYERTPDLQTIKLCLKNMNDEVINIEFIKASSDIVDIIKNVKPETDEEYGLYKRLITYISSTHRDTKLSIRTDPNEIPFDCLVNIAKYEKNSVPQADSDYINLPDAG